jgi:hypothetical protein
VEGSGRLRDAPVVGRPASTVPGVTGPSVLRSAARWDSPTRTQNHPRPLPMVRNLLPRGIECVAAAKRSAMIDRPVLRHRTAVLGSDWRKPASGGERPGLSIWAFPRLNLQLVFTRASFKANRLGDLSRRSISARTSQIRPNPMTCPLRFDGFSFLDKIPILPMP